MIFNGSRCKRHAVESRSSLCVRAIAVNLHAHRCVLDFCSRSNVSSRASSPDALSPLSGDSPVRASPTFLPVDAPPPPVPPRSAPGVVGAHGPVRVVQPWGGGTRTRMPATAISLGNSVHSGRFSNSGGHHYQRLVAAASDGDSGRVHCL